MRRLIALVITAIAAFLAIGYSIPAGTMAQPQEDEFSAQLAQLNGSGASGFVTIEVDGNELEVELTVSGVSAGLPHAQHIHIGGQGTCPTIEADTSGDGLINTAEGQPAYGGVQVSLTTTGDVSAASALAVDRFPVPGGNSYTYSRTFTLPDGVSASDLTNGVVVVHGISELFNNPNAYDGTPRSSLTDTLPLEATIPTACGPLFGEEELEDIEEQQEDDADATEEALEDQQDQAEEDAEATQEAIEEQEEANAEATEAAEDQAEENAEATQEALEDQEEANAEATEAAEDQAEEDAEATQEANERATEAAEED